MYIEMCYIYIYMYVYGERQKLFDKQLQKGERESVVKGQYL